MADIIPAVMPENFEDLEEKISQVSSFVPFIQVDVMDAIFVPSRSWPYEENGLFGFSKIINSDTDDFWMGVNAEVDLMVSNPEDVVFCWAKTGAKRLIFHIEAFTNFDLFIKVWEEEFRGQIELGVALNTTTPNEKVYEIINEIDFVQFMGIEKIGYQAQAFDERVLEKISQLRKQYPETIISVDGGVSLETAPKLIEAGANRLVSGSAIFKSDNIENTISQFKAI